MDLAFFAMAVVRLVSGLALTLKLASASLAIGGALAIPLVLMNLSAFPLRAIARAYIFVFRGTPLDQATVGEMVQDRYLGALRSGAGSMAASLGRDPVGSRAF